MGSHFLKYKQLKSENMLFINGHEFDPNVENPMYKDISAAYKKFLKEVVRKRKNITIKEVGWPRINPTGKNEIYPPRALPSRCQYRGKEVVISKSYPDFVNGKADFSRVYEQSAITFHKPKRTYQADDPDDMYELFYLTHISPELMKKQFIIEDKESEAKGRVMEYQRYVKLHYLVLADDSPLKDRELLDFIATNYGISGAKNYGEYQLRERLLERVKEYDRNYERTGMNIDDFTKMVYSKSADPNMLNRITVAFEEKVLIFIKSENKIYLSYDGFTPHEFICACHKFSEKIDVAVSFYKNNEDKYQKLIGVLNNERKTIKDVVTMDSYDKAATNYAKLLSFSKSIGVDVEAAFSTYSDDMNKMDILKIEAKKKTEELIKEREEG